MKYVYFTEILEFTDNEFIIEYEIISSAACYVKPLKSHKL